MTLKKFLALRAVTAIDLNVAFRQIAGEKARFTFAILLIHNADAYFRFIQFLLQLILVVIGRQTRLCKQRLLQLNIDIGRIETTPE